ncbi:MAG: hypothetical protein JWP32_897 [Schumannella sp.]|nr:hypothetical protein [Schumannella sp.]
MRRALIVAVALASALMLSSCALLPGGVPGGIYDDDHKQADARMEQIGAAVNSHDADALKALFSSRALEQATNLDAGLDYFLSFFPKGGVTWKRNTVDSEGKTDHGKNTELLSAVYKVSADGKDYWFAFEDFTVNAIDPESAGLYALGVTPWAEDLHSGAAAPFFAWSGSIHIDNNGEYGYPGIYMPDDDVVLPEQQGDARMDQIVAAVDSQDSAALMAMFSTRALEKATGLEEKVSEFFATFPDGGLTWERQIVNSDSGDLGKESKLLTAQYKVSAGGQDYWLFFADYAVDTIHPDNVGLAALAVTPWTEPGGPDPDPEFTSWNSSWIQESSGPYGIYVPTD